MKGRDKYEDQDQDPDINQHFSPDPKSPLSGFTSPLFSIMKCYVLQSYVEITSCFSQIQESKGILSKFLLCFMFRY